MEKRKIVTHRPTNLLLPHPGTREPKGIAFDEARPSSNKNTWFGAITRSRSLPERKGVRGRPFDCHSSPGSGGRPTCYVEAGVGGRSIPPRETDREREGERERGWRSKRGSRRSNPPFPGLPPVPSLDWIPLIVLRFLALSPSFSFPSRRVPSFLLLLLLLLSLSLSTPHRVGKLEPRLSPLVTTLILLHHSTPPETHPT